MNDATTPQLEIRHPEVWELAARIRRDCIKYAIHSRMEDNSLSFGTIHFDKSQDNRLDELEAAVYDNSFFLTPFGRRTFLVDSDRFALIPDEFSANNPRNKRSRLIDCLRNRPRFGLVFAPHVRQSDDRPQPHALVALFQNATCAQRRQCHVCAFFRKFRRHNSLPQFKTGICQHFQFRQRRRRVLLCDGRLATKRNAPDGFAAHCRRQRFEIGTVTPTARTFEKRGTAHLPRRIVANGERCHASAFRFSNFAAMRIIRGKYGRRRFDVPKNITARPTTDFARENLFNVLENLVDFEELTALDLFAGTGAMSFELLSRGCKAVTAVEKSNVQCQFIKKVAQELNEKNLTLVRGDVFRFIASAGSPFDIVFADPPYALPRFAEIPELVLQSGLLQEGSVFVIEHSRDHDFSQLPHFADHRAYGSVNFSIFIIRNTPHI